MDPTPAQKQAPNLIPPKRQLKAAFAKEGTITAASSSATSTG